MQLTILEAQKILSHHLGLDVIIEQAYTSSPKIKSDYLKRLDITANLPACDGEIIQNADVTFNYIDSDFKNWKLNQKQKAQAQAVEVFEMTNDATSQEMFESFDFDLDKLCLTQSQIIEICRNHKNLLRTDGYETFFLFRKDEKLPAKPDNLFAAYVRVDDNGLYVRVNPFARGGVWHAKYRPRVVLPQLTL